MVLEGSSRPRPTSLVSLDLAEAHRGSSAGISRSSAGHHLAVGDHIGHLDGEVGGFGEGETLCLIGIGDGVVDP